MFNPEKFKNKLALVIGAGKSGVSCSNLLAANGFKVILSESRPLKHVRADLRGLNRAVTLETGGHTSRAFTCVFAVKSPGLARSSRVMLELKKRGVPVFSEVETAMAFSGTKNFLAVTGTNGKTTTTELLGAIMEETLKPVDGRALVCGNVGIPASAMAQKARAGDFMVMELSSYQLEDSSYLSPSVSCVLNITPDHLDHHGTMAAYMTAKKKIFRFQGKDDFCVLNYEDPRCRAFARLCAAKTLYFSSARRGGRLNAYRDHSGLLVFKTPAGTCRMRAPALPGAHNLENAMCAGLMALAAGPRKP